MGESERGKGYEQGNGCYKLEKEFLAMTRTRALELRFNAASDEAVSGSSIASLETSAPPYSHKTNY